MCVREHVRVPVHLPSPFISRSQTPSVCYKHTQPRLRTVVWSWLHSAIYLCVVRRPFCRLIGSRSGAIFNHTSTISLPSPSTTSTATATTTCHCKLSDTVSVGGVAVLCVQKYHARILGRFFENLKICVFKNILLTFLHTDLNWRSLIYRKVVKDDASSLPGSVQGVDLTLNN